MTTELQNEITTAINTWDSPAAIHILSMAKKDPSLGLDPKIALQLRYVRMNSLSVEQLLRLMDESILAAFLLPDFDLDFRIKDYLEQIDNVGEEMKFYHGLLKVLDTSDEALGNENIALKGVSVKPTIGNWLEDFSSFPSSGREKDALAEIEYLNKSANVKSLTEADKNILKNIIKLYDHAVQNIALFDSIVVPKSEKDLYKDYDLYKLVPEMEEDLAEEAEFKKTGKLPVEEDLELDEVQQPEPVSPTAQEPPRPAAPPTVEPTPAPAPAQTPTPRPSLDDISLTPREPVKYKSNSSSTVEGPMSASDSAKIRGLINHKPGSKPNDKRGVTMDPTNIKINEEEQRLNQARAQQSANIQSKLAELRKRNSKQ